METILLVEDDQQIALLLKELLERYDFHVIHEDGLGDVVARFEETQPDVILLDVNLPKFDGFYWCRQLRMKTRAPDPVYLGPCRGDGSSHGTRIWSG